MSKMRLWDTETHKRLLAETNRIKGYEPIMTMYKCPVCGKGFLFAKPFENDRERLLSIKGPRKFFCSHCGKEMEAWETELITVGAEKKWGYTVDGKVLETCTNEEMMEFTQELTDGLTKEEREKKKEVDYYKWVSENGDFLLRFLKENGFVKREETLFGGGLPIF